MNPFRVLSLFAGIGGFDLGLERTGGFKTVAFCEIDHFAVRVLNKHWPEVPVYGDVRELTGGRLAADGVAIDCIVGGFPCQDISDAGKRAGIEGSRSGLWSHFARLIGELRPRYVIVENVAALLGRGVGRVLGDLAALGYDAEWHCIPACAVGASHRRDRFWCVAWDADGSSQGTNHTVRRGEKAQPSRSSQVVALSHGAGHEGARCELPRGRPILTRSALQSLREWEAEPAVGRVADGIPDWSHRIKALGNAVVPQIPELIGRAILAWMDAAA
jgi:DNA (cytosine-5)-methyltransferase 1